MIKLTDITPIIVYGDNIDEIIVQQIKDIVKIYKYYYKKDIVIVSESNNTYSITDTYIYINANTKEATRYYKKLCEDSYAINVFDGNIYLSFTSNFAGIYVLDRFEKEFLLNDPLDIINGYNATDTVKYNDCAIVSRITPQRDPYIITVNGVHYMYGTNWKMWKYTGTTIKENADWLGPFNVVTVPNDAEKHFWAPEVYSYNGCYYMATAYFSSKNNKRGVHIFRSKTLEGPFEEYSDGPVTPSEWDSIDGNIYIDNDGQPWMFFVHEWTSTDDGMGRMDVAKMSPDLHHFISEPIEIFRAEDAYYNTSVVTDGPEVYKLKTGELLMIWASDDAYGYDEVIAISKSGSPLGPWTQEKELFSLKMSGTYEGGHGMIFTDVDGQMYLSFHAPDSKIETPNFLPIRECAGTLIWDLYKK